MTLEFIIVLAVIMVAAWGWETRKWRRKPREEMIQLLASSDWRQHRRVLKELVRRGESIEGYALRFAGRLISPSQLERTAAEMLFKDCYPELAAEIKGYSPGAKLEDCRLKAAPLLNKLGINISQEAVTTSRPEIPQAVVVSAFFAMVLGLMTVARVTMAAYAAHKPLGSAFFIGISIGFWFFVSGGSLYGRNRWGYLALLVLLLLPLPGIFGLFLILLQELSNGTLSADWPETIHCTIGVLQLALTAMVVFCLLKKEVRTFIWQTPKS